MEKYSTRMMKYFAKHTSFNSYVHFAGGIGVGFLLTYPIAQMHPVRWGIAFISLGLLGHVYAAVTKP